jgi:hypothetical protein
MNPRTSAWLAWSLAGLSFAMFLAGFVLFLLANAALASASWGADLSVGGVLVFSPLLAFSLVGALIASGRPGNPIGWICLTVGLLSMLRVTLGYYGVYGVARPGSVPFPVVLAGLGSWLWVPSAGLLGTYLLLLFPNGRLPSSRWRPLAWLSGAVLVSTSAAIALKPGSIPGLGGVRDPFGLEGATWVGAAALVAFLLLILCMLGSALSLLLRYRSSGGDEREQIKWIAFASSMVVVVTAITTVVSLLSPGEAWFAANTPAWLRLMQYAAQMSLAAVPIAVGFAVLRYRLYDVDLLINRTIVYGSLTLLLAATYSAIVISLQYLLRALTGQESTVTVVASTLAIAALFDPLRRRVQTFVDRLFYRRKYDAARILEGFSAELRDETDLVTLSDRLLGVVSETMQPTHASLWLRPDRAPQRERGD